MESLPATASALEIAEFDTELVVYDAEHGEIHLLSGLAAIVFDACSAGAARSELATEISEALHVSAAHAEHGIDEAIASLASARLITPSGLGLDESSSGRADPEQHH